MASQLENLPQWKRIAGNKQSQRDAAVREWAEKTLGTAFPRLPEASTKNVRQWPIGSGYLTSQQCAIIASTPSKILRMVWTKAWSAEEIFTAFSTTATIAHYLTNPFTEVFFEKGLKRAKELDHQLWQTGQVVGPLHGLPLSLKDVMNLQGHATTSGFVALANNVQQSSDELVRRLYQAGAVFYCKTNVPQALMSGECNNFLYGRTSTPDNRLLSAGGSSGGEGSLIALRGSPLGIGTDIAGSIRTPANFNGVYGLCPTYGRFPCHSASHSSIGLINGVAGPISSSLDGLELYSRTVLSFAPWEWDATCHPLPWNEESYRITRSRATEGSICFGFISHDSVVRPHPPIERGLREVKAALTKAGHQAIDVDLFRAEDKLWDLAFRIFCADGGHTLRELLQIIPEPPIKEMYVPPASMAMSATELENESKMLLRIRETILRRWQDTARLTRTGRPVDVFILPSGGHVAPPHGTMEYFLYEAISNIIDWPCGTIPVGNVDTALDPKPGPDENFIPMSEEDLKNWQKCK